MLDGKFIRTNFSTVKQALQKRQHSITMLDAFPLQDCKRREILAQCEQLKNKRNICSGEIANRKKTKENADELINEMRKVGENIKILEEQLREVTQQMDNLLLSIPNIPHLSVPFGKGEEQNQEVRRYGELTSFVFPPKSHWELGDSLGILDFERGAKVSGSRFVFYRGLGARLERALINFMMDLHTNEHGYEEIIPPCIVNKDSMYGTGQLPKFAEDAFKLADSESYLIPTSEVPLTNFYRDEILSGDNLPKSFVGFSSCFRSEAGSAGRDTRGLIRLHQFHKIELVHITKPEDSYDTLETVVSHAEKVLQLLQLPYRVIVLCTGDLGFTAAKTYDLEVWLPSSGSYREISSCSNCEDFQARRINMRYRPEKGAKPAFVHTLNGSGLAVGRTVAAVLENYQQPDGSVLVPEVLIPYMSGKKIIK